MDISTTNSNVAAIAEEKNSYVFQNDSIALIYTFWAEGGVVAFSVYNKLDIPIYVDWKKCSYVSNNNKLDYWSDAKVINGEAYFASKKIETVSPAIFGGIVSQQVVTAKERITFIPPRSYYYRADYKITDRYIITSPSHEVLLESPTETGAKIPARVISFNDSTTLRRFRNYITWSTKENFEQEHYIDNEFYVSKVTEVRSRDFSKVDIYGTGNTIYHFSRNDRYYVEKK